MNEGRSTPPAPLTQLPALPPPARLLNLLSGYMVTQALAVVAHLSVAEHLTSGPVAVDELATRVGADPDALYRVLRAVASLGVFEEVGVRHFAQTPMSELLRADHRPSLRHLAMVFGGDLYQAWGQALHSVKTGEPAFPEVFGAPHFEYLAAHPSALELFTKAMAGGARGRVEAVLGMDWSTSKTVVDVGGGDGTLLLGLLQRNPELRGTLFDLPEVIERARPLVAAAPAASRCTCVGGSFFDEVPGGADVYILTRVLHDWNDADAKRILERCRAAAPAGARLVIVDDVIADGNTPQHAKLLDLQMLVILGGRERTGREWTELLGPAGFRVTHTRADGGFGVVEAVAV